MSHLLRNTGDLWVATTCNTSDSLLVITRDGCLPSPLHKRLVWIVHFMLQCRAPKKPCWRKHPTITTWPMPAPMASRQTCLHFKVVRCKGLVMHRGCTRLTQRLVGIAQRAH